MGKKELITAKEIVDEFGISYSKVNLYTNLGFLKVRTRKGNRRLYNKKEVKAKLTEIKKMIDEGYPLRLIRKRLVNERERKET